MQSSFAITDGIITELLRLFQLNSNTGVATDYLFPFFFTNHVVVEIILVSKFGTIVSTILAYNP